MTQITYRMYYWDGYEQIDYFNCIFPDNDEDTRYWERVLAMNPLCLMFITDVYPEYTI